MVELEPGAREALRSALSESELRRPIRIELQFRGCCDAVLGLAVDTAREDDLVDERDGLTFVMSPDVHSTVGEVTISYRSDPVGTGFVLTSETPPSEWAGFGVCQIRR